MSTSHKGGMELKAQAVYVEERKGVTHDVGFCDLPDVDDVSRIVDQVSLGEHGPFGLAGGSGGVDDEPWIIEPDIYPWKTIGS